MKKPLICLLAAAVVCCWAPGVFAASHSDNGCYTCHIPHNAGAPATFVGVPLWNPATVTKTTFTLYSSQTFNATMTKAGRTLGQPDGSSRLCLGCHDGSYSGSMNGVTLAAAPGANFGTDLSTVHPVSFIYDVTLTNSTPVVGELKNPLTTSSTLGGFIDGDLLDKNHEMQCVSCHDVHTSAINQTFTDSFGNTFNPLLRYAWDPVTAKNDNVMCQICHNK